MHYTYYLSWLLLFLERDDDIYDGEFILKSSRYWYLLLLLLPVPLLLLLFILLLLLLFILLLLCVIGMSMNDWLYYDGYDGGLKYDWVGVKDGLCCDFLDFSIRGCYWRGDFEGWSCRGLRFLLFSYIPYIIIISSIHIYFHNVFNI